MLTDSKMKLSVTHMFQKLTQPAFGNLHNRVIRGWQEHTQCWANDHIVCWRVVILFYLFLLEKAASLIQKLQREGWM